MMPQDFSNNSSGAPAALSGNFSADEVSRLVVLRHNVHADTSYLGRVIDQRRLEFARWLLENGKLSEAR
ncbi:MAG: hypothetical protein ACHQ4H_04730 [Ktedonobacterales bacterium]